jgi:hypothetical protein
MNALRESRKPSVEMPRRDFLKLTVAASGGLLVGFYFPGTHQRLKRRVSRQTHLYASAPTSRSQ